MLTIHQVEAGRRELEQTLHEAEARALGAVTYRCAWRDKKSHAICHLKALAPVAERFDRIARAAKAFYYGSIPFGEV